MVCQPAALEDHTFLGFSILSCVHFFFFFEIPFLWYFLDLIEALDLNNKDFLRNYIIATFSRLPYSQRLKGCGSTINFIWRI